MGHSGQDTRGHHFRYVPLGDIRYCANAYGHSRRCTPFGVRFLYRVLGETGKSVVIFTYAKIEVSLAYRSLQMGPIYSGCD